MAEKQSFPRVEAGEHPDDAAQVVFEDGRKFGFGQQRVAELEGGIEDPKSAASLIASAIHARRLIDESEREHGRR